METEKYKSKNHMVLLYPDNEQHMLAMEKIMKSYDYLAIFHDRDYFTAKDEKKNPKNKAGTPKKPHYHIVLRFSNQRWSSAITKDLGIEDRFIENVSNFDRSLLYLLHFNDSDKAPYQIDETFGTFQSRLQELVNDVNKSEGEKVNELIEYIESQTESITIKAFARYCAVNGYWAEFRRSASIFIKIIDEHNTGRR